MEATLTPPMVPVIPVKSAHGDVGPVSVIPPPAAAWATPNQNSAAAVVVAVAPDVNVPDVPDEDDVLSVTDDAASPETSQANTATPTEPVPSDVMVTASEVCPPAMLVPAQIAVPGTVVAAEPIRTDWENPVPEPPRVTLDTADGFWVDPRNVMPTM
jgi:hypothetical protein